MDNELINAETTAKAEGMIKIYASDYGIEESRAKEVEAVFTPMLKKMSELEDDYNKILSLEITPDTCKAAKELRLQYVKVRTATAEIHKKAKSFYLNGGRFIDGWKNAQLFASQSKEESLANIENHFINLERERKETIRAERISLISPYVEDVNTYMLGEMSNDGFNKLLAGAKLQYEMRIEAERKAEEERIERERAEEEERERQRLENIRLKKEAEEREKQFAEERERQIKEQERKDAEINAERERLKKESWDFLQQAKKEKEERERIEAELKQKMELEKKAIEDEKKRIKAEEKKLRLAPDKTKLLLFMQSINDLPRPEVKTIEAADIASKANIMLIQVVNFIKNNSENL
jgi:colicin import membrane protein